MSGLIRLLALFALLYLLGFAGFMVGLGQPLGNARSDAVVVLTGGPGRIAHGLDLLQSGAARRMLISGADPQVRPRELAAEYHVPARLFACCIDIGYEAVDTRSNAEETAAWVRKHRFRSVRLVTSNWHMPRARLELTHALRNDATVVGDAVAGEPRFAMLVAEYNKFLVRGAVLLSGIGS